MRVLVVEDEPDIAQFICQGLGESGYAVDLAVDGLSGLDYLLAANYDLLLLDILLPKLDGLQVLSHLRKQGLSTPVLVLTACDTVEDRIRGLDAGADDYLVKPFAFSELLARIRALLRRPPLQVDTVLYVGTLQMDTLRREVLRSGQAIALSPREFTLLEYLMRHADRVLTRTQLAEHVWNFDFPGDFKVVDVYIGYLRRKLARSGDSELIHTVRGVGYRLSAMAEDV
ncbi:MAG: response regulator transcription factor [Acaryochloridaceae cyanobacterium RU_4_10]|nr:response regulator transcription factor [Acaryochloridaceae cyanobacterium RU_4_10]